MEFERAKKIAAKLISFKMYTASEVYKKLIQKGISDEIAEKTVAEFCKAGILNDVEYAKAYIHDGILVNMKGAFRIKKELIQKGVAKSVIEKAMKEADVDMTSALNEYVELRFGGKVFSDRKEIEKAKAHLIRRGFGIYEINKCFENLGIKVVRGEED